MGKHEELMTAIHRADVAAVSKLLAKSSGSKSSKFIMELVTALYSFFHLCVSHVQSYKPLLSSPVFIHFHNINV